MIHLHQHLSPLRSSGHHLHLTSANTHQLAIIMRFAHIFTIVSAAIAAIAVPVATPEKRDDASILDQATDVLHQLNKDLADQIGALSESDFSLHPMSASFSGPARRTQSASSVELGALSCDH